LLAAAALALLGVFVVYASSDLSGGLPLEASLKVAEGNTTWHQEYKYGVRFKLSNFENGFNYLSKGNAADQVARAVESGGFVRVLYDPDSLNGPVYSDQEYFSVFAVELDGNVVRSYDQVASAWQSDNRLGFWFGCLLVVIGVGISVHAMLPRSEA